MKTKLLLLAGLIGAAALSARAGVDFGIQIGVPAPRVVVTPQTYVWDGYEYVGTVGDQYYYMGNGGVWLPLPQDRYQRFHEWEGNHSNWRAHAIRNEHSYHRHAEPMRYYRADDNQDRDNDHRDNDRDRDRH